jgi:hypothetical protein
MILSCVGLFGCVVHCTQDNAGVAGIFRKIPDILADGYFSRRFMGILFLED